MALDAGTSYTVTYVGTDFNPSGSNYFICTASGDGLTVMSNSWSV